MALGTGLAFIAGYSIKSCKASNYYSLTATVIEVNTKEIGFHDRGRYGPPFPVYDTSLILRYQVNGTQYTGQIRTSEAGFSTGTEVSIICSRNNPSQISIDE